MIVAKFGGSSLADADAFRAAAEIIRADARRSAVVVSAPGRRFPGDRKLTDRLYDLWERRDGAWQPLLKDIFDRFDEIASALGVAPDWQAGRDRFAARLRDGTATRDFVASRGEYFCAILMAAYLDRPFLDSADWLRMNPDGTADSALSYRKLRELAGESFVTPGFYGALADGTIRTFPRGGSDVTGALAAAALQAELYENWTDVPGIFEADPADFPEARPVRRLTYRELNALGAVGVQVLHSGTVRPVREAKIPLVVRSTRQPQDPGTQITADLPEGLCRGVMLCFGMLRSLALLRSEEPEILSALLRGADCEPVCSAIVPDGQTVLIPMAKLPGSCAGIGIERELTLLAVIFSESADSGAVAGELCALLSSHGVPVRAIFCPGASGSLLFAVPDAQSHFALRVLLSAARLS